MAHDPRRIEFIVVHHTASDPVTTGWRTIQAWHWARFKMRSGYHRIIELDGFVMDGRRIQQQGAHAPPNANRFGIVVTGWNGPSSPERSWAWNDPQWESLLRELRYWCERLPNALICGHNQTKATECPGVELPMALISRGWEDVDRLLDGRIF